MEQKTKKQHVVPHFYLSYFSTNPEALRAARRIWVFDKINGTVRQDLINNVAQQRYFYDLPPAEGDSTADHDVQVAEKFLARFESMAMPILERVASNMEMGRPVDDVDRWDVAQYLALQTLRTFQTRDHLGAMYAKLAETLAADARQDDASSEVQEEAYRLGSDKVALQSLHVRMLLNADYLKHAAATLLPHIWTLGINNTGTDLWTSDAPLIRIPHRLSADGSHAGFTAEGIELVFPVGPNRALVLLENTWFFDRAWCHDHTCRLGEADIRRYNEMQAIQCNRQVFSPQGDFSSIQEILARRPDLRHPQRPRVYAARGMAEGKISLRSAQW